MVKIALCDDDKKQLELMKDFFAKYKQEHPHIEISIASFVSPLELLTYVETRGGFDIYLLDVYMSGILGTQAAKQLRDLGDKGEIIFITSSRDHALEAFEVEANQYLIKPFVESTLVTLMDKVFERLNLERRHYIHVKTNKGFMRIFTRDIVFTEAGRNNYQLIHLKSKEIFEIRMTSAELFELLTPTNTFVKCGVSISMNLRYIRQITKESIFFDTGEHITYPYRAYQKLKDQFLSFQLSSEK